MLKVTFQQIERYKAKHMEQLKIIKAFKTTNLIIKNKIKDKKWELKNLTINYISNIYINILNNTKVELLL